MRPTIRQRVRRRLSSARRFLRREASAFTDPEYRLVIRAGLAEWLTLEWVVLALLILLAARG